MKKIILAVSLMAAALSAQATEYKLCHTVTNLSNGHVNAEDVLIQDFGHFFVTYSVNPDGTAATNGIRSPYLQQKADGTATGFVSYANGLAQAAAGRGNGVYVLTDTGAHVDHKFSDCEAAPSSMISVLDKADKARKQQFKNDLDKIHQQEQQRQAEAQQKAAEAEKQAAAEQQAWAKNSALADKFNAENPGMTFSPVRGYFMFPNNDVPMKYTCDLITLAPISKDKQRAIKYVKNGLELVYTRDSKVTATFAPYMEITKSVELDNKPWDMVEGLNGNKVLVNKTSSNGMIYVLSNCGESF